MLTGFKMRACAMLVVAAFTVSSGVQAIDDSYVSDYVASANNDKVCYADGSLKIYTAVPVGQVVIASLLSLPGIAMLLVAGCGPDMRQDDRMSLGLNGLALSALPVAYLAYIVHEVSKTIPYISLSSTGLRIGANQEVAWSRIASVDVTQSVTYVNQSTNIGTYGAVGTSQPVVVDFLTFTDKYGTSMGTICDDGWLAIPFENLTCLAQWYQKTYSA